MDNLNSNLITVNKSTLGEDSVPTVNAREMKNIAILDEIAKLAYSDHKLALLLLKKVDTDFVYLKDSVLWLIQTLKQNDIPNEFHLHKKFFDNLNQLIPNAKVVKEDVIREHKPDGFIEINNELYGGEMKLKKFDCSALKQICRYMRHYTAKGIAVSKELTCVLPDDVIFVKLSV